MFNNKGQYSYWNVLNNTVSENIFIKFSQFTHVFQRILAATSRFFFRYALFLNSSHTPGAPSVAHEIPENTSSSALTEDELLPRTSTVAACTRHVIVHRCALNGKRFDPVYRTSNLTTNYDPHRLTVSVKIVMSSIWDYCTTFYS